jgi:intracellular multiplication protein IcmJ
MKVLFPSFAPPEKWRNPQQSKKLEGDEWKALRQRILARDNFTCTYCGYRSEKYQIVDHIDGDPENNSDENFQIVCQMCNLIKHSGQGCVVQGIVDLYSESKYSQSDVIRITREMRDKGASDDEIIQQLGLKSRAPFKMDRAYLRKLFGFVTSRTGNAGDMYNNWLRYHQKFLSKTKSNTLNKNLSLERFSGR